MLHFLATVALLLFIGERLARYIGAWRLRRQDRRDERRYMAMLYPPAPRQPAPGWLRWIDGLILAVMAALVVSAALYRMGGPI